MLLFLKSAVTMLLLNSVFGSSCLDGENSEKKFRFFKETVNWHSALLNCSHQGMTLATIQSQEEQNKLGNILEASQINKEKMRWWIGGSDLLKEKDYIWFSTGEPMKYNNFHEGQPNNWDGNEHCLEILVGNWTKEWNYEWNDIRCDGIKPYICEYYECSTSLK